MHNLNVSPSTHSFIGVGYFERWLLGVRHSCFDGDEPVIF